MNTRMAFKKTLFIVSVLILLTSCGVKKSLKNMMPDISTYETEIQDRFKRETKSIAKVFSLVQS